MRKSLSVLLLFLCSGWLLGTEPKQDSYSRGIVILALEIPNKLKVAGREFITKQNPKGEGTFVYDPRTRFSGIQRNLMWIVLGETAYALNGPSKMLTPSLPWPREAKPGEWEKTGLALALSTDSKEIIFGGR